MGIIFFDGVCNLCNSTIQFIIKKDKKRKFKFTSLQSNFGQNFLIENNFPTTEYKSIILLHNNKIYTKSTAILMILKELDGYNYTRLGFLIPRFLRDIIYSFISNNRYLFFGKSNDNESCLLPSVELTNRFID